MFTICEFQSAPAGKKQTYPIRLSMQTLLSHGMNVIDSLRKKIIRSEEKPFGAQQMKEKQTVNVCMLLMCSFIHRGRIFYL